jgi:hypothetical protein
MQMQLTKLIENQKKMHMMHFVYIFNQNKQRKKLYSIKSIIHAKFSAYNFTDSTIRISKRAIYSMEKAC